MLAKRQWNITTKIYPDSPNVYLSNSILCVQFGWDAEAVDVLHCSFFLWEISHISIKSSPNCDIILQVSSYRWVLTLFSSPTGILLMKCTKVESWPSTIFDFSNFTDSLNWCLYCAEQSQIHPHTSFKSWVKSCEGVSDIVANVWWGTTWVVHCDNETHLVAHLLLCQTFPHNSLSNFCGMFMDVCKIAVRK